MIYKIKANGQKSTLNLPEKESDKIKLISKEVGDPAECFDCLGYAMYYNQEAENEDLPLNTIASQLAEIAMYGDVVIVGDDMSPLAADDIVFIAQNIEARKHHDIIYPPLDHETYY